MTWDPRDPAAQGPSSPGAQWPAYGQAPQPGYPPPPPGQMPPPGAGGRPGPWEPPPPYPQGEPLWQPPPAFPLAPDAYPVNVSYDRAAPINRLWGILWIGQWIRYLLLIPHYIVLFFVLIVAAFLTLFTWIPVLILGRFPGWGYRWIGGFLGWSVRIQAYFYLMASPYPPFSLDGEGYPVSVRFDEGVRISRLWGIPLVGILIRAILLIPHFVALFFIAVVVGILLWFTWIPVLFLGRQSDLIYTVVGGFTRWWFRVMAYLMLMVDRYPPFSLGEDDPHL
jgi:Domain of unknown function (DUF4389)